jgi:hypothetical protein
MDVTWTTQAGLASPRLYQMGVSYIIEPDTTILRPTDWDFGGRLTDKWVKGIVLECDTNGLSKRINIEIDHQIVTTVVVQAAGRSVVQFAFPRVLGRLLRLHPATTEPWTLYKQDWIFDEEPLQLTRFETQELTHGIPGWSYLLYGFVTMRSPSVVQLSVEIYGELASPSFSRVDTYILPATGVQKSTQFLPFEAAKGVLHRYIFTGPLGFHLHREETFLWVQPWGGETAIQVHPFGNDDLDLSRNMNSARLTAAKNGGGFQ